MTPAYYDECDRCGLAFFVPPTEGPGPRESLCPHCLQIPKVEAVLAAMGRTA